MNNNTTKPNCSVNNNDIDSKPIFLSNSVYEFCDIKNNMDDQLTIWGLDNMNTNDTSKVMFDMHFNDYSENLNFEEPILNNRQCNCDCTPTWDRLKQTLELTDEEILKRCDTLNFMIPEDIFCNLPIDLNDDQVDNLDDFQLDEEYMYTQLVDFNEIAPYQEENRAKKEEELIIANEPVVKSTTNNKPVKPDSRQKNAIQKNITKSNDTNIVNTAIESNEPDQENIQNENQKQNIKNKSKSSKKKNKRCTENELLVGLSNTIKENMMRNMKYVYTFGEDYRGGIKYGHKNCVNFWMPIPHNKGWVDDKFLEAERKKTIDKKKLRIEQEEHNRMKEIEDEKATIKKARQERAPLRFPSYSANTKPKPNKKVVKIPKIKKVEAVPAFKLNKNRGIYTITMNYYTKEGRLDKTEEPVVFKLADHTKEMDGVSSTSSFNVEFVTPGAINSLRPKKSVKAKVQIPKPIVEEVLPSVKSTLKKKV
ncbi:LOW QUALITY PROTEIN: uncharacterized protein LOC113559271 [Rhopalosiphum maidis]|uniref:LOW QUALITY PROTEIN: uncharacterized protein LOC113559271 n=1 Tax=Rhopalosiphum maidis TaxID=43146 RepID=UPI000F006349|nr:LOW QUALITY PROTEIN: uncharacterized protein LOC113559271 [Rhopalosiphum maidis]